MAPFLFPENRYQDTAYRNTRSFRSRHKRLIEEQKAELASLSPSELQAEIDRLRTELRGIVGRFPLFF